MTRILHVITTIDRGGAENQLLLLVREQIRKGHQVSILPIKGNLELQDSFIEYGARVNDLLINKNLFAQLVEIRRITKSFDIIHAHLPRAELMSAWVNPSRLVISRHNCETFIPNHPGMISRLLSRFVEGRAKVIVAISETVKDFLLTNKEAHEVNIKVVKYGFDSSISYGTNNKFFAKEKVFHIGTVSRLVPQKDLGTLLKAFSILEKQFPLSKLSIVGAGPDESLLKDQAKHLGIFDKVEWLGRVTNPLAFMRDLDVFVMTSIYEGFGLVVLEAMSQRVPVILSDNPTFREIFSSRKDDLFPVGDHQKLATALTLIMDDNVRDEALKGQSEILAKFSPTQMVEEMEKIYTGVMI